MRGEEPLIFMFTDLYNNGLVGFYCAGRKLYGNWRTALEENGVNYDKHLAMSRQIYYSFEQFLQDLLIYEKNNSVIPSLGRKISQNVRCIEDLPAKQGNLGPLE